MLDRLAVSSAKLTTAMDRLTDAEAVGDGYITGREVATSIFPALGLNPDTPLIRGLADVPIGVPFGNAPLLPNQSQHFRS